jgi:hypothetical protein
MDISMGTKNTTVPLTLRPSWISTIKKRYETVAIFFKDFGLPVIYSACEQNYAELDKLVKMILVSV